LGGAGPRPLAWEVKAGPDDCYRIDTQIGRTVVAEVDGYAYHSSPEQKAADGRRRNRLRLEGWVVLVYTWRDVMDEGARVVEEIRQALAAEAATG
ncbi:MAG: endonuclease domain-containing protein, partial [Acidimicrobiales bacterium]